ncbi:hypothetical protein GRS96_17860 [Rathayibacter sp. VKM Ac-2803]|uniref:hypothetical protein n=1 Tax=unclassified Rathayibacter TaxID=2609250 RepID=UPI001359C4C3|nr:MULTISPECIES: hypothetical protein [unclassified Rathayibacter]MWV51138.1 hypothetical protein [Rathayibacter sp. VKM Ac-2803]MWV57623.1 hypothetical protein [Rathayibacter sp. VKM Ac-2754]
MARQDTHERDGAPRGPERHTRTSEPAVDAPSTSPSSEWPTAPAAGPTSVPDRPASIRVKKKRKSSGAARARRLAKRVGYAALVLALLAGLAVVIVLIVAPHHLF